MNRSRSFVVFLALLGGCSSHLVPLTKDLRDRFEQKDLQNLQCYISRGIVLRRVLRSEEQAVTPRHTLKIDKDKRTEVIEIEESTPGVIVRVDGEKLYVSFEPPVEGRELFLVFSHHWQGSRGGYFLDPDVLGDDADEVSYGGVRYTSALGSRHAYLEISEEVAKSRSVDTRVLPGRVIPKD